MRSNFHMVMKINKSTCVLMYVILHRIAQNPVGKAQNLVQSEFKFQYSDEEHQRRQACVYVCCFAWNSSNSSGESSKSSSK